MTSRLPSPLPISEKDAAVLERLWNDHSRAVFGAALAFTGNEADAADVLALTFQRLASRVEAAASAASPRAFLIASSRNLAVDLARQTIAREKRHDEVAATAECVRTQIPPAPSDADLRAAIVESFASLPGEQRRVVEGRLVRGLTLETIARQEGVPLRTVASRFRYGIDKIREQLRPYYDCITHHSMKPITNKSSSETSRIIHALEPKRVPSVAPGLEGLAAFAPDDSAFDEATEIEEIPADELPAEESGDYVEVEDIENPEDIVTTAFESEDVPVEFNELFVIQTFGGEPTGEEVEGGEDLENVFEDSEGEYVEDGSEGEPVDPRILYMTGGPIPEGQPEGYNQSWVLRGETGAETGGEASGGAAISELSGESIADTTTDFTVFTDASSEESFVAEISNGDFPEVISLQGEMPNESTDLSDLVANVVDLSTPGVASVEFSEALSLELPAAPSVATAGADEVAESSALVAADTFVPLVQADAELATTESHVEGSGELPVSEGTAEVLAAVPAPSSGAALVTAIAAGTVLQSRPNRKKAKI